MEGRSHHVLASPGLVERGEVHVEASEVQRHGDGDEHCHPRHEVHQQLAVADALVGHHLPVVEAEDNEAEEEGVEAEVADAGGGGEGRGPEEEVEPPVGREGPGVVAAEAKDAEEAEEAEEKEGAFEEYVSRLDNKRIIWRKQSNYYLKKHGRCYLYKKYQHTAAKTTNIKYNNTRDVYFYIYSVSAYMG